MAKLLLFDTLDDDIRKTSPFVGKLWGIGAGDLVAIKTLKEFAAALHKQNSLEEVVLNFHGTPGTITVGNKNYSLSDKELKDAVTAKQSTIERIRFEGCWVGERPDEMTQFGSYFKAKEVWGYTWMGIRGVNVFNVPKGTDTAALRKLVNKDFERFMAPGSPSLDVIASRAKDRAVSESLMTEFFQYTVDGKPKPPWEIEKGATKTNYEKLGSHSYKLRKEAGSQSLTAARAAKMAEEGEAINPMSTFEYVQVKT